MSNKIKFLCLCLLILSACGKEQESQTQLQGNSLPFQTVSLANLDEFRTAEAGNWAIAGNIYADRFQEKHLEASEGSGILVNLPPQDAAKGDNLFTNFEHGDIDLELDFMMPKGSNSGVYLQGRYEVQLLDSWLKDSLTYGDMGGIYRGAGEAFPGSAPERNAAKAPGLWQNLMIRFRAPQFDESGKKIANARFEQVYLNGVLVQKGVEVSEPTLAAAFEDEKAMGPLMLQGDHGPVAFRNIRYKAYTEERIALKDMHYKIYDGMYKVNIDTLPKLKATISGTTDTLSGKFSHEDDLFVIEGIMEAPREGEYMFELMAGGPAWLYINSQQVTDNRGTRDFEDGHYGSIRLNKGKNDFRIIYANYDESLALSYEGPGIPWTELHTPNSARHWPKPGQMIYEAKESPQVQRGFMVHQGKKNTSAIAVGMPVGLNYAYDVNTSSPLIAWHGTFLDVGEMWIERGETQLAKAVGAPLEFSGKPSIAFLDSKTAAWPEANGEQGFYTDREYRILENGLPIFISRLEGVWMQDYLYPSEDAKALIRKVNFTFDHPAENLYLILGSGSKIEKLQNGTYAINDNSYYLENIEAGGAKPFIRKTNDEYQFLVPVIPGADGSASLSYSIIW